MLTSRELLAAVRARQAWPSNYALARELGLSDKIVQRWNTGKATPEDVTAVRLAELAGLDAGEVLAAMHAQRASDGPLAAVWKAIAERAHVSAAVLLALIFGVLVSASPDASAQVRRQATVTAAEERATFNLSLYRRAF